MIHLRSLNKEVAELGSQPRLSGRALEHAEALGSRQPSPTVGQRGPHPGGVGLVQLVEHDDGSAPVVVDQPPEVRRGALQRVQRHDEGCAPCVALWWNRDSVGPRHGPSLCRRSGCLCWPMSEAGQDRGLS